uniref:Uncharacterized protein n=1 Tax=Arundo donax TaxID=35708 RepID=A0A0A9G4P7_ARUDO
MKLAAKECPSYNLKTFFIKPNGRTWRYRNIKVYRYTYKENGFSIMKFVMMLKSSYSRCFH